ncbi:DUF3307 domain-containing protein [Cryptosporangium arvum]|uniref:DUF3307 domain-containing protein n=1 Tax=Cryptosporangium arvum DSM 44712 TaxID=927661 RepID=A0A010YVJ5_9ACTN|nr:DUF3307 domain-containing protein [Cryptosporangium arvum]EXG79163.1 Protein of unknown function (DUF3307) [Cryptosporangium arvum DSM 44712]
MSAATPGGLAVVFVALYAAHQVADHWVQTQHQADHKGRPGWVGRIACFLHVATYTATALVALLAAAWRTGLELSPAATVAGLLVSAVTHYIADRRTPLRIIADRIGSGPFYRLNTAGMNGAYLLDQSWHIGWLFVAALVIGGAA